MSIEELDKLPWAASNIPDGWDFRNKTPDDMAPLCFGVYSNTADPPQCKILYGGEARARVALAELSFMGIPAELVPPTGYGWAWDVRFRLESAVEVGV